MNKLEVTNAALTLVHFTDVYGELNAPLRPEKLEQLTAVGGAMLEMASSGLPNLAEHRKLFAYHCGDISDGFRRVALSIANGSPERLRTTGDILHRTSIVLSLLRQELEQA